MSYLLILPLLQKVWRKKGKQLQEDFNRNELAQGFADCFTVEAFEPDAYARSAEDYHSLRAFRKLTQPNRTKMCERYLREIKHRLAPNLCPLCKGAGKSSK